VGPRAILDAEAKRKVPSPRRESNFRTQFSQQPRAIPTELQRYRGKVLVYESDCFTSV
jgi:hypothetical protein